MLAAAQARDAEERERWIRALEDCVVRHNQLRWTTSNRLIAGKDGVPVVAQAGAATIQDFDKKLAEADTYLQLLLSEFKSNRLV